MHGSRCLLCGAYDVPQNKGDRKARFLTPCVCVCVRVCPHRAGGEYNDLAVGVTRMLAQPWVEEYDIADNYWTPKAPLPEGRFRYTHTHTHSYFTHTYTYR